uniref:Uncharacterized protein n=1 Tax=Chromulina nebulosa TaxID=96789 RepID=A0A7S0XDT0_9STRA|mmetsp:Transcript_1230/g.1081  ORF Transcript_1230/g.1081 Transcript_1230/m.1081 type:complete len:303 (+) Transcript_1230:56-964(+)
MSYSRKSPVNNIPATKKIVNKTNDKKKVNSESISPDQLDNYVDNKIVNQLDSKIDSKTVNQLDIQLDSQIDSKLRNDAQLTELIYTQKLSRDPNFSRSFSSLVGRNNSLGKTPSPSELNEEITQFRNLTVAGSIVKIDRGVDRFIDNRINSLTKFNKRKDSELDEPELSILSTNISTDKHVDRYNSQADRFFRHNFEPLELATESKHMIDKQLTTVPAIKRKTSGLTSNSGSLGSTSIDSFESSVSTNKKFVKSVDTAFNDIASTYSNISSISNESKNYIFEGFSKNVNRPKTINSTNKQKK